MDSNTQEICAQCGQWSRSGHLGITVAMTGLFTVQKVGFRKYYEKVGSKFFSGSHHESRHVFTSSDVLVSHNFSWLLLGWDLDPKFNL